MKKKYLENNIQNLLIITLIVIISSCSNKYEALRTSDKAPVILTNKDTLTVRVKDYSNYNLGAGYLKISLQANFFQGLNLTFIDSSKLLKVFYDEKPITLPLPVNQYTIMYIGCEKIGQFPLLIKCVDAFGNSSSKRIIINSIDDVPPVAVLTLNEKQKNTGSSVYTIDASLSVSQKSKITSYQFYVDNFLITSKISKLDYQFYSGTHTVSVIAIDDLGKQSDQVQQTITIQ